MAGVSIIITAKNAASATFDRIKGDVKGMADSTQKATSGMKAAHEAVARAMHGDLVGAAQSAGTAFKALWAVVVSNPLVALAAAAVGVAVAIYKFVKANREAAAAAAEHGKEMRHLRTELEAIGNPTFTEQIKSQADALAEGGDEFALRKRIQAIKDYVAELRGLADMKIAEMGVMTNEKDIAAARAEYDKLAETLKTAAGAQKTFEGALASIGEAQKKIAEEAAKTADKQAKEAAKAAAELARAEAEFYRDASEDIEKELDRRAKAAEDANHDVVESDLRAIEAQKKAAWDLANEKAAAAKKAAEDAEAIAAESMKRATDSEYRREAVKLEKSDKQAAEKAERAYERALEKSRKGITGKGIDAAIQAKADAENAWWASQTEMQRENEARSAEEAYKAAQAASLATIAANTQLTAERLA